MILWWIILVYYATILVDLNPTQVSEGVYPYVVFFVNEKSRKDLDANNASSVNYIFPISGTIINPRYVLTLASFFGSNSNRVNKDPNAWSIVGAARNKVPVTLKDVTSHKIEQLYIHPGYEPNASEVYNVNNLCLAKVKNVLDSPGAPIGRRVKYSYNKKAYPVQNFKYILVVYWLLQNNNTYFVKYQLQYEPRWITNAHDSDCGHVNDKGTALYCLFTKDSVQVGKSYPGVDNSIALGSPIIIDNELMGIFVGMQFQSSHKLSTDSNHKCHGDPTNKIGGAHLGVAVVNSNQVVHPQHEVGIRFLRDVIGTQHNYSYKDLIGTLFKTTVRPKPAKLQVMKPDLKTNETTNVTKTKTTTQKAVTTVAPLRKLPKCLLDGSLKMSFQKYLIFADVLLCLTIFIDFNQINLF